MSFLETSLTELRHKLKNRSLRAVDLVKTALGQVQRVEPQVKGVLHILEERALAQAAQIDAALDRGEVLSPLAGIPIAIKDNLCLTGTKTTCASKILENFVAPYTATAVQNVLDAGLIPVVKTNMDEFAMGSSNENSAFFTTQNPWDLTRVPGGSSGGSAAVVAAGEVPLSLGSDTGGSIRQPAAFCGIVGVKPTYGRVSRYGLVAFASSLDQIGPFARTVEDAALLMNVICGHDAKDSTSATVGKEDFTATLNHPISGLRIGVPKELFGDSIAPEIREAVSKALDFFKANGASWSWTTMSSFEAAVSTYYILAPAEASANLARFDGVRYGYRHADSANLKEMFMKSRGEGFGPEVKRRILLGTYVLSSGYYDAYYVRAQKIRQWIRHDFAQVFNEFDVILTPTTPNVAFKFGENAGDPVKMYLEDIATIPVNLAGVPGMSLPCGFSNGLPIGMQLIGKSFDEATLFRLGHFYQQHTDFHTQVPAWLKKGA